MIPTAFRTAAALAMAICMFWGLAAGREQPSRSPSPVSVSAGASAPAVVVVYSQPPKASGGILLSSLRHPDGSSTDQWAWDGFRFAWTQTVTEVHWRGAYDPARLGSGGPVFDFTVSFYVSVAGGQPDVAHPPLVHYDVGSNAGETAAAVLGGVQTYDYRFVLPTPFQAAAGTKYWVQIEAFQSGPPDWGLSAGINGDGQYFRRIPGQGANYQMVSGDTAFSLLAPRSDGSKLYLPMVIRLTSG